MDGQTLIRRPETFEDAIDHVLAEMRALMITKNRDYGPGNIAAFGEFGVVVRASDKVHRLANLLQSGKQPEHEKIEDTWLDLANYGLIGLLCRRDWWGLPMEDEIKKGD